jgi:transcriptional regulator with XRE-family HTH domain
LSSPSQLDSAGLDTLLGPRLRERRTELGKTLADVAGQATLSTGYLSSIEKGSSIPSLPVLARIAHALDVSLAEILRGSGSARVARGRIDDDGSVGQLAMDGSQLQIVRCSSGPGEKGDAPLALGRGDVFVFLHEGALEITVDDGVFKLGPGDALHCDRPKRVAWRVIGKTRARALWVSGAARSRIRSAGP